MILPSTLRIGRLSLLFVPPTERRRNGDYYEARIKTTRKEAREHLGQFHLACELAKLIRHCFPDLLPLLKQVPDSRHQSYITYPGVILLMTRILSSLFYINSMRKTSEEFNSENLIKNICYFSRGGETYNYELYILLNLKKVLSTLDRLFF